MKSTYTDCDYILGPYLQWLKEPFNIKIVYFSFEMDRVSIEYDFACWFLHNEYGIKDPSDLIKEKGKQELINFLNLKNLL